MIAGTIRTRGPRSEIGLTMLLNKNALFSPKLSKIIQNFSAKISAQKQSLQGILVPVQSDREKVIIRL